MFLSTLLSIIYFSLLLIFLTCWLTLYLFYRHARHIRHRIAFQVGIEKLKPYIHLEVYHPNTPDNNGWGNPGGTWN